MFHFVIDESDFIDLQIKNRFGRIHIRFPHPYKFPIKTKNRIQKEIEDLQLEAMLEADQYKKQHSDALLRSRGWTFARFATSIVALISIFPVSPLFGNQILKVKF